MGRDLLRFQLLLFFIFTTRSCAQIDSCLRGFTQTIPSTRDWDSYAVLDVNGGSFIYTELMFTCNGTVNAVTVPFSTIEGQKWSKDLSLELVVWRRQGTGGYADEGRNRKFPDVKISNRDTMTNVKGNATLQSRIRIQRYDILQFKIKKYGSGDKREHIPFLLIENTKSCTTPGCPLVPMVHVDFTSSEQTQDTSRPHAPEATSTSVTTSPTVKTLSDSMGSASEACITQITQECSVESTVNSTIITKSTSSVAISLQSEQIVGITAMLGSLLGVLLIFAIGLLFTVGMLAMKVRRYQGTRSESKSTTEDVLSFPVDTLPEKEMQYESIYEPVLESSTETPAQNLERDLHEAPITDDKHLFSSHSTMYWQPGNTLEAIHKQLLNTKCLTIKNSAIELQEKVGEGEFGIVFKGQWKVSKGKAVTVALKTLKSTTSDDDKVKLFQEAAIMGQFMHPSIAAMYGCVNEPHAMLAMEYLEGGSLQAYLPRLIQDMPSKQIHLTYKELLRFCKEIADGMNYLSRKGFIHRDLAARNILLTADTRCKIADFGMSRDLEEDYYYKPKGGRIPVKWTAPEAIFYKKYTTKSDVWSYGMVMYEIWSLGQTPFKNFKIDKVVEALNNSNYTHPSPKNCPRAVYIIMSKCWYRNAKERLSFQEVMNELQNVSPEILSERERSSTEYAVLEMEDSTSLL